MARRGNFSQSFLRSKELLAFSEISHNKEGTNILKNAILTEALARNHRGEFIRNKVNIAKILDKYGVIYRMVFNAMNMDQYTYNEVQKALDHLAEYINDLGISGIVEFHAADKTQNSDHIHFWISSEESLIYTKIAQEMVAMGYSNKEDVYIQKHEDNQKLDEIEYVNNEDCSLNDRFSINSIEKKQKKSFELDSLQKKYFSISDNIYNIFKQNKLIISPKIEVKSSLIEDCTLAKTKEINSILSRIKELQQ